MLEADLFAALPSKNNNTRASYAGGRQRAAQAAQSNQEAEGRRGLSKDAVDAEAVAIDDASDRVVKAGLGARTREDLVKCEAEDGRAAQAKRDAEAADEARTNQLAIAAMLHEDAEVNLIDSLKAKAGLSDGGREWIHYYEFVSDLCRKTPRPGSAAEWQPIASMLGNMIELDSDWYSDEGQRLTEAQSNAKLQKNKTMEQKSAQAIERLSEQHLKSRILRHELFGDDLSIPRKARKLHGQIRTLERFWDKADAVPVQLHGEGDDVWAC